MDGEVRAVIKFPCHQQGVLLVTDNVTRVLRKGKFDVSAPPLWPRSGQPRPVIPPGHVRCNNQDRSAFDMTAFSAAMFTQMGDRIGTGSVGFCMQLTEKY